MAKPESLIAEDMRRNLGRLPSAVGSAAVHRAFTETAAHDVSHLHELSMDIDAVLDANDAVMRTTDSAA